MRLKRARAFLIEPSSYLNDHAVLRLNTLERGAYSTLLFSLWDLPEPGVVEDHPLVLQSLSRTTSSEWESVRDAVALAFDTQSRPGFWIQKRMVKEHQTQTSWVSAQKARGRLGGRPKRYNELKPMGFENGTTANQIDSFKKANTSNSVLITGDADEKEKTLAQPDGRASVQSSIKKCKETVKALHASFHERFWPAYPVKKGKAAALKAWEKVSPNQAQLDAIMDAVEKHKLSEWSEPKFIPHPATWLNGRRWEDEVGQAAIVAPGASNAATGALEQRIEAAKQAQKDKYRKWREDWEREHGPERSEVS